MALSIFALGHTVGMLSAPRGPDEAAALTALAAFSFDIMGSVRTHHDFYRGEGWFMSASLVVVIGLCWQLSNATQENPGLVRRLLPMINLFCAVSIVLCTIYFFAAPLVASAVALIACTATWWRLGRPFARRG